MALKLDIIPKQESQNKEAKRGYAQRKPGRAGASEQDEVSRQSALKASRTRRQRGYHWEDAIVKKFNSADTWKAFRLGSPSVALPDVLAVSTARRSIFVIEAKSGASFSLYVPADQIERCMKWISTFDIYRKKNVVLAFKFLAKRRIGTGIYEHRKMREFFKVWPKDQMPVECSCNYRGEVYLLQNGVRTRTHLDDGKMPFAVKS